MCTFYFVRHAHSIWTGDEQRQLSARGLEDAELIARILLIYPIDRIYSSPYRRAIDTIKPLAETLNIPLRTDKDLAERRLGHEPVEDFRKTIEHLWLNPNLNLPGGESNNMAKSRGLGFIKTLLAETELSQCSDTHIVISTHGNLLSLILQHFYPLVNFDFWDKLTFPDIYMVTPSKKGSQPIRLWTRCQ